MRGRDWVYLGQLVRALQLEGVDGTRIGEMVAEVEQHLAESGADPVDEFGPPPELAGELARRPGTKRPGWVPPLWLSQIGALVLLLIAAPLATPFEWGASTIPVLRGAVSYSVVFYLGVSWIGYAATKRLDGRSWRALTGWRFFVPLLAMSAIVTLLLGYDDEQPLVSFPKVPYLAFSAVVIPVLFYVLVRRNNPVRFPEHAQHLRPLKWGPFAGWPPVSSR